ncbi:MAG TPA: NAD-dependent epimerase/dehydratase family protein [Acidimicrobiales bacterium]|nr:NAD-dependent epimerase/dehydratase family protein [Acidimicrobiales bacterium]
MGTVVITGVETPLGRRVARLVAGDAGTTVVGLAGASVVTLPPSVEVRRVDLVADDVKPHVEHADAVLHLAASVPDSPVAATDDVAVTRHVLDAAGDAGVRHLVVLSSATVYGAWPDNPVPLTEAATLRPNPGVAFAAERAEIERLTAEWREAHPGATATILRPARAAGSDHRDWLVRALRPGPAVPDDVEEPPVQFVDLDDLAAAVDLGRRRRLDGVFNVAPEGWIPGDQVRSLTGAPPNVRLPARVAGRLVRLRFRWGLGPTPPELVPYTLHPWVVASDRLRAEGWAARVSNDEACVEAHEVGAWATLSPRRRQELALGAAGIGLAGLVAGAVLAARRWLRS